MSKHQQKVFIFLVFFLNVLVAKGQNELKPLAEVLTIIENRYEIHFSYLDQTIAAKQIEIPSESLTLEQVVEFLRKSTNLDFVVIDEKSIVISSRTNPLSELILQKLEEVVVTNYLTQGISKKSDGKIVIDNERFGILPGLIEPDILQTLQALPGVLSVDETVTNLNVRGGTHDQNLILWDGIKMYQSGHFFGLVSAFNPYLTKSINLSKNGTSVKYGDGVSSVIDMQQSTRLDGNSMTGLGLNMISVDAFSKIPLSKKTEVQLSARRSITDYVYTPTYDQYLTRAFQDSNFNTSTASEFNVSGDEQFYFYDFSTKFLYDVTESNQLRFNFSNISNYLNYNETATPEGGERSLESNLQQNSIATGIEYLKYWNNRLTTTAQAYYSTYDLNTTNFDITNNQRLNQENKLNDFGLKINATNHIDDNLKLHGGYQFNAVIVSNFEDVNNPNFQSFSKQINRTHSIYAEAEFTSENKKTYARIGMRTNYIDRFSEFFTEPRLSVSHKLNNDFRLEFLAELKSQTTSQIIDLQNDFLGIENRRWVLSNTMTIPIIESRQGSFGIHYKKNDLLISTDFFLKAVDGITSRSQGFQNQFQLRNDVGKYETRGIDFLINKKFGKYSSWLSYSYSKNDYQFENLNEGESFPNNLDIRHAVTFANTYEIDDLKIALGINWHSGKPETLPTDIQPSQTTITYQSPNNARLPDYLRTDFSMIYKLKTGKKAYSTIGVSVWNVLNRTNVINSYYVLNEEGEVVNIENRSLGITPNVSFRLNF